MQIKLSINVSDTPSVSIIKDLNLIDLCIYSDLQVTFKDLINKDNVLNLLEKTRQEEKKIYGVYITKMPENIVLYLSNLKNTSEVLFLVDENKSIKENYELIRRFLLKNKELKDKKVILDNELLLTDTEKIEYLFNYFNDFTNVYVILKGETSKVNLKKLKDIIEKIDNIVLKINKQPLSPFEKAMYAYDLVRDRKYKKAINEDNNAISRELPYVLFEEEIVCLGFANIYNCVLQKLGINSEVCILMSKTDEKKGHARNVMYLKDDKYDIEGVYFSDPTFDSKKNNNDFLYSYRNFCKPYLFFKKKKYVDGYELLLDDFEGLINEYIENGINDISISELDWLDSYVNIINRLSRLIEGKRIIGIPKAMITKDKFKEKIDKYKKFFNSPISAEKFLKALEVVRKEEYLNNPEKYPYGYEAFLLAALNSSFKFNYLTGEERFLLAVLGKDYNLNYNIEKKYRSYVDETGYGKEAEQIKLATVLKKAEVKKKGKN